MGLVSGNHLGTSKKLERPNWTGFSYASTTTTTTTTTTSSSSSSRLLLISVDVNILLQSLCWFDSNSFNSHFNPPRKCMFPFLVPPMPFHCPMLVEPFFEANLLCVFALLNWPMFVQLPTPFFYWYLCHCGWFNLSCFEASLQIASSMFISIIIKQDYCNSYCNNSFSWYTFSHHLNTSPDRHSGWNHNLWTCLIVELLHVFTYHVLSYLLFISGAIPDGKISIGPLDGYII